MNNLGPIHSQRSLSPIQEPAQAEYIQVALAALAMQQQVVTQSPSETLKKILLKGDASVDEVRSLIKKYNIDVDSIKVGNETMLVFLCKAKKPQTKLIALFLEKGANTSIEIKGYSLLQFMCLTQNPAIVALLLKKTESYAAKFIKNFYKKFLVGHINGMPEKKDFKFLGGVRGEPAKIFACFLKDLPKNISEIIADDHRKKLEQAFTNAPHLVANDKTVDAIKRGDLVEMPVGYLEHSIDLVFCNGYLSICNRSPSGPIKTKMLEVFRVDKEKFSLEILNTILGMKNRDHITAYDYLYKELPRKLFATKDAVCKQLEGKLFAPKKGQKIGNCTYASAKLALRAATGMLHIKKEGEALSLSDLINSKRFSKGISTHVRFSIFEEYYNFHDANPGLGFCDPEFSKEILELADKHLRKNSAIKLTDYPSLLKRWGRFEH